MKRGKILWVQPLPLPLAPALSTPHFVCYQIQFGVQFSIGITALCVVKFQRQHRLQRQTSSPSPSSTNWVSGLVKKGSETSRWKKKKQEEKKMLHKKRRKRLNFLVTRKWEETTKVKINIELLIHNTYLIRTHSHTHTLLAYVQSTWRHNKLRYVRAYILIKGFGWFVICSARAQLISNAADNLRLATKNIKIS